MRVRNARQEEQPLLAIRPQPSVNDNVDRQNIIIVVESEDENDEFSDQEDDEEDAMPMTTAVEVFGDKVSMNVAHFTVDVGLSEAESKRLILILEDAGINLSFQSFKELKGRLKQSSIARGLPNFVCVDLRDNSETSKDHRYFPGPMLFAFRDVLEVVKLQLKKKKKASEFKMRASRVPFFSEIQTGRIHTHTQNSFLIVQTQF